MRTARLLPVSRGGGGGVCSWKGGVCSWEGVFAPEGRCLLRRGVCSWGCPLPGGGGIPACNGADPPLCIEFLTHATENNTLPQLCCGGNKRKAKDLETTLRLSSLQWKQWDIHFYTGCTNFYLFPTQKKTCLELLALHWGHFRLVTFAKLID